MANRNKRVVEELPEPIAPIIKSEKFENLRTVFIHIDKVVFFPNTNVVRPGFKDWFAREISYRDVVILVTSRRTSQSKHDDMSVAHTLDALRELNRQKIIHWDEFLYDCQGDLIIHEKIPE